ncbi:VOC family protein [Paraglaciecola psychrophila]|uniref:Glyoxalase/bleomycin resistance protein/dioxygenase n=1 Tax=Paraglaciecola psychrophila 170 TaxID=1129794 RepID=K7ATE1_9ALTE|nr:VOC family protein [Paraglaciecola psychrophila]AGH44312.1 glyoxalase/bleomycin resistance protein/dioxygenase [Paraglaciecola psychrophila 170]GAC38510.1 glyoxalase family protein [Paraglaciecola psychrophila 170]
MQPTLEHINITVTNTDVTAAILAKIFNWKIRWAGAAKDDDKTIHLGTDNTYLALYRHADKHLENMTNKTISSLNHIGIQVDDINAIETKVKAAGLMPYNHGDYEPGKRFYFNLEEGLEIEVVSYQ